jgi:putative transposase
MKTLKQHIRKLESTQFEKLTKMCRHSNSLYNCCLYVIKEYFKQTGKYIGQNSLYKEIKNNEHYKALPAKMSQQIVRLSDKNYRSFFALLKKKNRGQYGGIIKEPRYRKSGDLFNLILPNDQINLIKGKLKITKDIRIPFSYKIDGKIKQAVIKPKMKGKYYEIFIAYEPNKIEQPPVNKSNLLSIDLGIDNFVSCFSNVGHSFIVSGKPIKAYNQYYNKQKSKIQSELETKNRKKWSNKLEILTINRKNYIDNYFNQAVNLIKKYCIKNQIGKVICGYNESWKQNINIGKINNQKFMSIPYYLFKQKLESKLAEIGIEFVIQEESYTSKCSFMDNEEIKEQSEYVGKRVKRGLFRTNSGLLINSDINGAANIMRKAVKNVVSKDLSKEIVGGIVHPIKLKNLFSLTNEANSYFSI